MSADKRNKSKEIRVIEKQFRTQFKWVSVDFSNNLDKTSLETIFNSRKEIHGIVNNAAFAYDDLVSNLKVEQLELMYETIGIGGPENIGGFETYTWPYYWRSKVIF